MGIKDFSKIVAGLTESLKWSEFSGKTVAMDAMFELHTAGKIPVSMTDSSGNDTGYLKIMMNKILKYMTLGIIPVYAFDNEICTPLKKNEQIKRKKVMDKTNEALEKLTLKCEKESVDYEDVKEYSKLKGWSFKVTGKIIAEFQKLLRLMGVAYVIPPPEIEGEQLCVYLQKKGYVDYIYTSDRGDVIAFGGTSVLSKSIKSGATYVDILYAKDIFEHYNIDYERFVEIAVALGSDFSAEKVKGVGPKTVFSKKFKLNDDQKKAKEYFMSKVPNKYKYVHKTFNPKKLMEYLKELEFSEKTISSTIEKLEKYYA